MTSGVLYGLGIGPGDPELITLKAARLLSEVDVVAYPQVPGRASLARSIAAAHLPNDVEELAFDVPMAVDRAPGQSAYDAAAGRIAEHLEAGRSVAVLCEGDPLFYGSFMYLNARLSGRFGVEIVPGVTSVGAASARLGKGLIARDERLSVISATSPEADILAALNGSASVAILKVGRHLAKVKTAVSAAGLMDVAAYVERASMAEERVMPLAQAPEKAPYFSMILVIKGADPWL